MIALLRRAFDGLGTRIALVMAVALLPLAVVSTKRSQTIIDQSYARSEAALEGETLRAIAPKVALIDQARGTAFGLASMIVPQLNDPRACAAMMRQIVNTTRYSFAGYYDTSGFVACSSADAPFQLEITPDLAARLVDPVADVRVNERPPVSQTSVVYATAPVYGADGQHIGFTAVSLPQSQLSALADPVPFPITPGRTPDAAFYTLNQDGLVLTYSGEGTDAGAMLLPQGLDRISLLSHTAPFSALSSAGVERTYAIIPLFGGHLFALGTWPKENALESSLLYRFPALFPALMWGASLIIALLAAELFVTRHVRLLRSSINLFGQNRRGIDIGEFESAPVELREMAQSHAQMTDEILREEAELEDTLRQKDVLLREVHHRVKNNLQLIASIMNMQMRKSRSEEARSLMRGLHDRVMSLATVHKGLYQTSGLADVHADELLGDILRQITHLGNFAQGGLEIEQSYDRLRLSPEQAVPLSLLVTEALTNAVKYAGHAKGARPRLRIKMQVAPDLKVVVTIANSLAPPDERPPEGPVGLGSQLLAAFSQQLHGTLEKHVDDEWFTVVLTFQADPIGEKHPTAGVF